MWATGMMDPDWWKVAAISHKWYRDEEAYADYMEANLSGGFGNRLLAVHYIGARALAAITFTAVSGPISFSPSEDPFEVKSIGTFELKDSKGDGIYRVIKIVCEKDTLTFNMVRICNNEEVTVMMGIAPEGFTTDLFADFTSNPVKEDPSKSSDTVEHSKPKGSSFTQFEPWVCACGTENTGKFCTQCGHPRTL